MISWGSFLSSIGSSNVTESLNAVVRTRSTAASQTNDLMGFLPRGSEFQKCTSVSVEAKRIRTSWWKEGLFDFQLHLERECGIRGLDEKAIDAWR